MSQCQLPMIVTTFGMTLIKRHSRYFGDANVVRARRMCVSSKSLFPHGKVIIGPYLHYDGRLIVTISRSILSLTPRLVRNICCDLSVVTQLTRYSYDPWANFSALCSSIVGLGLVLGFPDPSVLIDRAFRRFGDVEMSRMSRRMEMLLKGTLYF